jgi:hypothetical protein
MGYRSDVLIAVAFSSVEHRDEVWALHRPTRAETQSI